MPAIRRAVVAGSFRRAYRRRIQGTALEEQFRARLTLFMEDPFQPKLETHKLRGSLSDYWAFTIAYDCRVVFRFVEDDVVLLVDIGRHDEVY